jgi:hypothetical protein
MDTGIISSDVSVKYDTNDEIRAIICHERIYDRVGRDNQMNDVISIITNHAGVLQKMSSFLDGQHIQNVMILQSSHKDGQSGYLVQVVIKHQYFYQVYNQIVEAIGRMLDGNNFGEGSAGAGIRAFTDLYRDDLANNYGPTKVIYQS